MERQSSVSKRERGETRLVVIQLSLFRQAGGITLVTIVERLGNRLTAKT